MPKSKVKVELNHRGVAALLDGPEAQAYVARLAGRIARRAGEGMEVTQDTDEKRARAVVITTNIEAMLAEARSRALTRAIDAGRDN